MKEKKLYRFTDWNSDGNDRFGSYSFCLKIFKEKVKDNPDGRYSIYDLDTDEGVLFNKKCSVYQMGE